LDVFFFAILDRHASLAKTEGAALILDAVRSDGGKCLALVLAKAGGMALVVGVVRGDGGKCLVLLLAKAMVMALMGYCLL